MGGDQLICSFFEHMGTERAGEGIRFELGVNPDPFLDKRIHMSSEIANTFLKMENKKNDT
jgi:hypothetical protein